MVVRALSVSISVTPNTAVPRLWKLPAGREFFDLHALQASPVAREALNRIGAPYQIESGIRGRPPDERRRIRQLHTQPLMHELKAWFEQTLSRVSTKSELAVSIRYALTRWVALTHFMDDGRVEIDNNAAERALRCVALGRKNYFICRTGCRWRACVGDVASCCQQYPILENTKRPTRLRSTFRLRSIPLQGTLPWRYRQLQSRR